MTVPGEAINAALARWLDRYVDPDAIHWREMAERAFIAGAVAERDRLQAEMGIVRAAGAAAERNAREGRKAGAAAERDRCHTLIRDASATFYDEHGIKMPACGLLEDPS